ncbi:MAG TPA: CBS domain-containing protein [Methylomirabilota bacterium]|jgi:acetoin utilization protein AcuB
MRHPKRSITRDIRTRRPLHPGRGADEREALQWPDTGISVADYMTRSPATVHSDALVRGVVDMMRKRKIRHLPVVDREGHLVGIVTDRNLRQVIFDPTIQERLGDLASMLNTLTVRDVMTWGVITVRPEAQIREAARLMRERKVGALPVLDGERVVGMLTETDVLRAFQDVLDRGVLSKPYRWALTFR